MSESANPARSRAAVIAAVLEDLQAYRPSPGEEFALEETIRFFHAIRSYPGYLRWLFSAGRIDPRRLLELTDFPFAVWDRHMHRSLMAVERRSFPGLVRPLVKRIVRFVEEAPGTQPLVMAHVGAGGMEVDRQVVRLLMTRGNTRPIVIIGIDSSSIVGELAKQNLPDLGPLVSVEETDATDDGLRQVTAPRTRYTFRICREDVFRLDAALVTGPLDLAYHSLFKHHIPASNKDRLDRLLVRVARNVYEYDGYRSWFFILLPQTLTSWRDPVLLNATIVSSLRFPLKRQLRGKDDGWRVNFSRIGTYLREFSSRES